MAKTDANPPLPSFPGEYVLQEVSPDELQTAVKPKQFIHIDQSECIMCEGCVDICPWKCIHMLSPDTVSEAVNTAEPGIDPDEQVVFVIDEAVETELPGEDPSDHVVFLIDDDVCTRCALCVDRCPTGVIIMGKVGDPVASGDAHQRTNTYGYGYGMRLG